MVNMHLPFAAVSVLSLLAARVGLMYILLCVLSMMVVVGWVVLLCCRLRRCCSGVVGGSCVAR